MIDVTRNGDHGQRCGPAGIAEPLPQAPCWAGGCNLPPLRYDVSNIKPNGYNRYGNCQALTFNVMATGCAQHRGGALHAAPKHQAWALVIIKDVPPVDLLRHLEFHLLLGIDRAVYVDNSCGGASARDVLERYIARGLAAVFQLRCKNLTEIAQQLPPSQRGSSGVGFQILHATRALQPPRGSLVLPLDIDEYLHIGPTDDVHQLADEMQTNRISAALLKWRLYGTSDHRCQPRGPIVRAFLRRAPLNWYSDGRWKGSSTSPLLPTHASGKPMLLWGVDCRLNCSTHFCRAERPVKGLQRRARSESWRNCAAHMHPSRNLGCLQNLGVSGPWRTIGLAHYRFQSLQYWSYKGERGGVSSKRDWRSESVPATYEQVHDDSIAKTLDARIACVRSAPLRQCLAGLFEAEHYVSEANASIACNRHGVHPPTGHAGRVAAAMRAAAAAVRVAARATTTALAAETSRATVEAAPAGRVALAAHTTMQALPASAAASSRPLGCASLPPTRQEPPSEAEPLAFFHIRKSGGSELRRALAEAGAALNLSHFIPCLEASKGSWIPRIAGSTQIAHLRSCHTYHLDALVARPLHTKAPVLYAGHFPYHMSSWFGAHGWSERNGARQPVSPSAKRPFSCIMFIREPVHRFQSCYNERLARGMGYRPLVSLSREELSRVLVQTDGVHSCSNEIVRWAAPTHAWGEDRNNRPGLFLTEEELMETKRRMDQCVVANIVEHCESTVQVVAHWFPWLSGFLSAKLLCMRGSSGQAEPRKHLHGSDTSSAGPLATWQRQMIVRNNLQDLELYQHGMRRFNASLACALRHVPEIAPVQRPSSIVAPPALPEECNVTPQTTGTRVAVLFYGTARNASATLASIHGRLLTPLREAASGSLDVFVHLMHANHMSQSWSGEHWDNRHAGGTNTLLAGIRPCRFSVSDQDAADLDLQVMVERASAVMGEHANRLFDTQVVFNLFRSRLSMQLAAQLVMAHCKTHGVSYTHLVLARPDVLYSTPLVWRPEDTSASVRVPDSAHDFCPSRSAIGLQDLCTSAGVNDRFAIGAYPTLLTLALGRLKWLQRFSINRNSEHLWCTQLADANTTVGLLRGLELVRVRSDGERLKRDERPQLARSAPLRCAAFEGLRLVRDWGPEEEALYSRAEAACKPCRTEGVLEGA